MVDAGPLMPVNILSNKYLERAIPMNKLMNASAWAGQERFNKILPVKGTNKSHASFCILKCGINQFVSSLPSYSEFPISINPQMGLKIM